MRYLAAALLFLGSCSMPKKQDRVDITIINRTDKVIRITLETSDFPISRTIHMGPGEKWPLWIKRDWIRGEGFVTIREAK